MTKRCVLCAATLLAMAAPLIGQESAESLLARYLKPGIVLQEGRQDPEWPSDREVLLLAAAELSRTLRGDREMATERPWARDGYLELPIRVRGFSAERQSMYYWYVAYVHPEQGLVYDYTYRFLPDIKTGLTRLQLGEMSWPNSKPLQLYVIPQQQALELAQQRLGIRVGREPMAVMVFVDNLQNGSGVIGWLWYLRDDEGFEWDGRRVHSVFVLPFARVKDVTAVTLDELADSRSRGGLALARQRMYTYEGEDVDLYTLDRAQREYGFTPVSENAGDPVYLPRLRVVPLLPAETDGESQGRE